MPKRRIVYEEEYVANKLLARRVSGRALEYLVAWEGYGADGDTWEPATHLTERLVQEFNASRSTMPPSIDMVVNVLRDRIARQLLENKGPMFGIQVDVEMAAIPGYADAIFKIFAAGRDDGVALQAMPSTRSSSRMPRILSLIDCAQSGQISQLGSGLFLMHKPNHTRRTSRPRTGGEPSPNAECTPKTNTKCETCPSRNHSALDGRH